LSGNPEVNVEKAAQEKSCANVEMFYIEFSREHFMFAAYE